jgi:hypothetical protein
MRDRRERPPVAAGPRSSPQPCLGQDPQRCRVPAAVHSGPPGIPNPAESAAGAAGVASVVSRRPPHHQLATPPAQPCGQVLPIPDGQSASAAGVLLPVQRRRQRFVGLDVRPADRQRVLRASGVTTPPPRIGRDRPKPVRRESGSSPPVVAGSPRFHLHIGCQGSKRAASHPRGAPKPFVADGFRRGGPLRTCQSSGLACT